MRFLPLVLIVSCISPTQLEPPTIGEKYEVLEQIILDTANNLFDYPLVFSNMSHLSPPNFMGYHSNESDFLIEILGIQDSSYLFEQLKGRRTLESSRFKSESIDVLLISELEIDDFWELINSDSIEGLYSVELPIFDETKKKCYIRTGYLCGELCGSEQDILFQLDERTGKWEIAEELGSAIY